jgi:hypothetical protein
MIRQHSTTLVLVKSALATQANARIRPDLMTSDQSVWVALDSCSNGNSTRNILIRGVSREGLGTSLEREQLHTLIDQFKAAAESTRHLVILGNLNLDMHRTGDTAYSRRGLHDNLVDGIEDAGLEYLPTTPTFVWMLRYKGGPRQSGLSVDLSTPGQRARQKRDILSTLKKKPFVRSKSPF